MDAEPIRRRRQRGKLSCLSGRALRCHYFFELEVWLRGWISVCSVCQACGPPLRIFSCLPPHPVTHLHSTCIEGVWIDWFPFLSLPLMCYETTPLLFLSNFFFPTKTWEGQGPLMPGWLFGLLRGVVGRDLAGARCSAPPFRAVHVGPLCQR